METASTRRNRALAYAAAMTAAVLMGSLGLVVRNITADAALLAFARLSLGCLFLVGFLAVTRNLQALTVSLSPYLVTSGLSMGLGVWCYIAAIAHTTLANAAFLLYSGPLLAVGFAHGLLKERLTPAGLLLIGLAFLGCLLVLPFDVSLSNAEPLGSGYGLLSALSYAVFIVANRKIPPAVSPWSRAFYQLLVATLTLVPFLVGKTFVLHASDLPWVLAVGFFQGFLALSLVIFAIRHLTAYEYGLLSYWEPVTALLIGVLIYAEPLTFLQALGGTLIVSSGLLQIWVARGGRRPLRSSS